MSPDDGGNALRVLVVDDEPASRELMCAALQSNGIEAVSLPGGAEALQALPRLDLSVLKRHGAVYEELVGLSLI